MLAEREGVAGRDVTPFVLSRVAELTGGKSVDANLALIEESVAQLSEKLSYRVTLKMQDSAERLIYYVQRT